MPNQKLLVPLDGSPLSAAVLPLARTLARATHATVFLVRAALPDPHASPAEALLAASQYLQRIADELRQDGLEVVFLARAGDSAADVILEVVAQQGITLVVMATHGRTGVQRAFLGSVAEAILQRSPVPVMLYRPGGKRVTHVERVLVPVDGTPESLTSLDEALGLARTTGAEVVLLHFVLPIPYTLIPEAAERGQPLPRWDEHEVAAAEADMQQLVQRLEHAGATVRGLVKRGNGGVAELIAEAAQDLDVDLLVVSTHAATGLVRTLFGSVADGLVRQAQRPVLLVRRHGVPAAARTE